MDVILTAGGTPAENELLYSVSKGLPKALIPIGGKAMIQWVLDALAAADSINRVVMIGLPEPYKVEYPREIVRIDDQGSMVDNIIAGSEQVRAFPNPSQYALVVASDIPAVTTQAIEWICDETYRAEKDLIYPVIRQETMEETFPGARRSYLPLRDMRVCGGDVIPIKVGISDYGNPLWRKLVATRKNALKQAALFGLDTLALILLRALTLKQTEERICKRLQLKGKVLLCPFAELGMDVDKPHQLELVSNYLKDRV